MNTDNTKNTEAREQNARGQSAEALLGRALPFLEQLLAAQGDNAERDLIMLQHAAVECLAANKDKPPPPSTRPSTIFGSGR